jgi:hypothetical protein
MKHLYTFNISGSELDDTTLIPMEYVDYSITFPNAQHATAFVKFKQLDNAVIEDNVVTVNSKDCDPYDINIQHTINYCKGKIENLEAIPKNWSQDYFKKNGSYPIYTLASEEILQADLGYETISNDVKSQIIKNILLGLPVPHIILHDAYSYYTNILNGVVIQIWHKYYNNDFELTNVDYPAFEGLYYRDLEKNVKIRKTIEGYCIGCTIIQCSSENPLLAQFTNQITQKLLV